MPNCVLFNYYCFNNMLKHVSYDIILELCELARNMSWLDLFSIDLALAWSWVETLVAQI